MVCRCSFCVSAVSILGNSITLEWVRLTELSLTAPLNPPSFPIPSLFALVNGIREGGGGRLHLPMVVWFPFEPAFFCVVLVFMLPCLTLFLGCAVTHIAAVLSPDVASSVFAMCPCFFLLQGPPTPSSPTACRNPPPPISLLPSRYGVLRTQKLWCPLFSSQG